MSLSKKVEAQQASHVLSKAAVFLVFLLIVFAAAVLGASPAADVLPKLAPVQADLMDNDLVRDPSTGHVLLRFTNTIGNYGNGVLHVVAYRDNPDDPLIAYQRVYRADGTSHDEQVGELYYHASHHHFHLLGAVSYRLMDTSLGLPVTVASSLEASLIPALCVADDYVGNLTDPAAALFPWACLSTAKASFCLADVGVVSESSPNYSHVPKFNSCAHNQQALFVQMGISVGWGDTYDRHLVGQAFDVSALMTKAPKWYTLESTTNPDGALWEENMGHPAKTSIQVYIGKGVPLGVGKSRPGV